MFGFRGRQQKILRLIDEHSNDKLIRIGGFTMGRSGCDINFSDDQRMTRRHCQWKIMQGEYAVRDMGSRNGTFLNGDKLHHRRFAHAKTGDIFIVGSQRYRVEITEWVNLSIAERSKAVAGGGNTIISRTAKVLFTLGILVGLFFWLHRERLFLTHFFKEGLQKTRRLHR